MSKLSVFNFVTLNGFYKGPNNDISWHRHEGEESAFAEEGANSNSILLFGRVTYDMMVGWWPTPEAIKTMPGIAEGMNKSEKIVFSTTLKKANWNNTRIKKDNLIETVTKLKQETGKDMTILGSGSIVSQLADHGLIDEYMFMVDPVALGEGTAIFQGIHQPLQLELMATRTFKSGVVLLTYRPLKK